MKFSSREDIDAPIEQVYRKLTDFSGFERQLARKGVEVTRDTSFAADQPGANWQARFNWRGRVQEVEAELLTIEPGQGYSLESRGSGVIGHTVVDLVALSQKHTRMFVSLDLKPTTLSSRLLIQSLRLTKSRLSTRFKARVADFARGLAD